jgi:hypothetical protein
MPDQPSTSGTSYEKPDRDVPDRYEITWMTGHIETVVAHQVSWPDNASDALHSMFGVETKTTEPARFIRLHAEIDGRWCLTLQAREEDIRTIRLVTNAEQIPGVAR